MNNNLHNMNMINTYLENASNELENALSMLEKYVSVDNNALCNSQIVSVKDNINNLVVIVKNNIVPKIQEME